jgi:hypothetical protein
MSNTPAIGATFFYAGKTGTGPNANGAGSGDATRGNSKGKSMSTTSDRVTRLITVAIAVAMERRGHRPDLCAGGVADVAGRA